MWGTTIARFFPQDYYFKKRMDDNISFGQDLTAYVWYITNQQSTRRHFNAITRHDSDNAHISLAVNRFYQNEDCTTAHNKAVAIDAVTAFALEAWLASQKDAVRITDYNVFVLKDQGDSQHLRVIALRPVIYSTIKRNYYH